MPSPVAYCDQLRLLGASALDLQLRAGAGLRRCQTGRQHAEWRAGYVVEAVLRAEFHGGGVAAVLAADTDLDRRPGRTSLFHRHLDQLPDAFLIKGGERVLLQNAFGQVRRQYPADVVAREAKGGLGEIVGAEAEELSLLGDLVGH